MWRSLSVFVSSFAYVGYAPYAPGTVGTLAALPLAWAQSFLPWPLQLVLIAAVTVLGAAAAHEAGRAHGVVDSGRIVIDEVAGTLITFFLLPFDWGTALGGFLLFRLFDIVKPWPARWFDRNVHNGWGVMLDDVFAGVYANLVLRLALVAIAYLRTAG